MTDMKQVKVDNWGIFFLQRLQQFFNRTDYCDLTLQFENNVQLKVHRLVMNACTEYFHTMENTCEVIDDCLVMPINIEPDVVVPIINFMYTGQLEFQMSNFDKLYSTARLMNMTILTKLLDAQKVPASPLPKPTNKQRPIGPITWNLQGKKIIPKTMDPDLPEPLPGRKLPVWKRKSAPSITTRSSEDTRSIIEPVSMVYRSISKRNVDNTPRPTRFEWPEDDGTTFESSFDDISYGSRPLVTPTRDENSSASSSAFEEIRKSVSAVKRPIDDSHVVKRVNLDEVKEYLQEHRLRTDYILKDDDSNEDDCYEDDTPRDSTRRTLDESTPKRTRFEGKENVTKSRTLGTKIKTIRTPGDVSNHAKIISEVLKKYPHLVRKNKNIKLKIMQKGDGTTSEPVSNSVSEISYVLKKSKESSENLTHGNPTGPWRCEECEEILEFEVYLDYRKHLRDVHPEKVDPLVCELCGLKSNKRNLLSYHMYTQHDVEPPINYNFPRCEQCDYIALSETFLMKHKETHTVTYKCTICDENFSPYMKFIKHCYWENHNKDMNFDCLYCTKRFNMSVNLISHMRKFHSEESKRDGLNEIKNDKPNDTGCDKIKILSNVKIDETDLKSVETFVSKDESMGEKVSSDETHVQVLDPSSEAEALSNVASGIATSLGLVDTIVVLDENQFVLHSTEEIGTQDHNGEQYILPEIANEMRSINSSCLMTPQNTHPFKEISIDGQNTIISTGPETIGSTDELVMVLTDHDYSDGNNRVISSENSNIVVLYSHPVEGQPTQYISRQGNIILDPQTGLIEMNGSKIHVANSENIPVDTSDQAETIEMIQREINENLSGRNISESANETIIVDLSSENNVNAGNSLKIIDSDVNSLEISKKADDIKDFISDTNVVEASNVNVNNRLIIESNLISKSDSNNSNILNTESNVIVSHTEEMLITNCSDNYVTENVMNNMTSSNIQQSYSTENDLNTEKTSNLIDNIEPSADESITEGLSPTTDTHFDTETIVITEDNKTIKKNISSNENFNVEENNSLNVTDDSKDENKLNIENSLITENQPLNISINDNSSIITDSNPHPETNLKVENVTKNELKTPEGNLIVDLNSSTENEVNVESNTTFTDSESKEISENKDLTGISENNCKKSKQLDLVQMESTTSELMEESNNDQENTGSFKSTDHKIESMEIDEPQNNDSEHISDINRNENEEKISKSNKDSKKENVFKGEHEISESKSEKLYYEEPMDVDGRILKRHQSASSLDQSEKSSRCSDENTECRELQNCDELNSVDGSTKILQFQAESKNNVTALVSDWCDDDSGLQGTEPENVRTVDSSNDLKRAETKNYESCVTNAKITKLLDDWDDGDTDSQHSATEQMQKRRDRNPINTLIDDWEDDE